VLREQTERLGRPIDLLIFDACLMANLEVAIQLAPYADTFVGSVEKVPSSGIPYESFVEALGTNTNNGLFDAHKFGSELVVGYCNAYLPPNGSQFKDSQMIIGGGRSPDTPITLSCINLKKLDEFVRGPLSRCISSLAKCANTALGRAALAQSLRQCPGYGAGKDYVGLVDFFELFMKQAKSMEIPIDPAIEPAIRDLQDTLHVGGSNCVFYGRESIGESLRDKCPTWYPFSRDRSGITFYFPRSPSPELLVVWQKLRVASLIPTADYAALIGGEE
jgi:hypothetical protein